MPDIKKISTKKIVWYVVALIVSLVPILSFFSVYVGLVWLSKKYLRINSIIASFVGLIIMISIVITASTIIEIILPNVRQYPYIYTLFAVLSLYILIFKFSIKNIPKTYDLVKRFFLFNKLLICVFFGTFVLIYLPFILSNGNTPDILALLFPGEDNSAHLGIIIYNLLNQSPAYQNPSAGLFKSLIVYPQGVHTFVAYVAWALIPLASIYTKIAYVLVIYSVFLSFFATMIATTCVAIFMKITQSKEVWNCLLAILLAIFIQLHINLQLIGFGFFTQLSALSFVLVCFYVLFQAPIPPKSLRFIVFFIIAAIISISSSWYLLLSIVALGLIPFTIKHRATIFKFKLAILAGISIALYPIILSLYSFHGESALLQTGAVYLYPDKIENFIISFGFVVGLILCLHSLRSKTYKDRFSTLTALLWLIGSVLLPLGIATYQYINIDMLVYYFYKCIPLLQIIAYTSLAILASTLLKRQYTLKAIVLVSLVMGGLIQYQYQNLPIYFSNITNGSITSSKILLTGLGSVKQSNKHDVLFASRCRPYDSYMLSKWSGLLLNQYSEKRERTTNIAALNAQGNNTTSSYTGMVNFAKSNNASLINLDEVRPCDP